MASIWVQPAILCCSCIHIQWLNAVVLSSFWSPYPFPAKSRHFSESWRRQSSHVYSIHKAHGHLQSAHITYHLGVMYSWRLSGKANVHKASVETCQNLVSSISRQNECLLHLNLAFACMCKLRNHPYVDTIQRPQLHCGRFARSNILPVPLDHIVQYAIRDPASLKS